MAVFYTTHLQKVCKYCILLLILIQHLGFVQCYAQTSAPSAIPLQNSHFSDIDLNSHLEIFQDTSSKLSFNQVKTQLASRFVKLSQYKAPFNSNNIYWLCFRVQNNGAAYLQSFLRLGANDFIQVYAIDASSGKQVNTQTTGIMTATSKKVNPNSSWYDQIVQLSLAPNQTLIVYYQIKNLPSQAVNTQATLLSNKSWGVHLTNQNLVQGVFQGVLGILFIIGLILFLATREKIYALYFLQILGFSFIYLPNFGYLNFITGSNFSAYYVWFISSQFASICYVQFVRVIVDSRHQFRRIDFIFLSLIGLRTLMLVVGLIILANGSHELVSSFNALVDLLSVIFGTIAIVYVFGKGSNFAKFLLFGTGVLITGLVFTILAAQGTIQGIVPDYFLQFGILSQYLIFSIGLGTRIQENFKREKAAQAQILAMEKNAKEELEQKVRERTHELSEANNEIITQNEELHQQHEEIIAQRDFIEIKNRELGMVNQRLQSSIKAAKSIQQAILPFQNELNQLLKEYFVIYQPKDVVSGDFYWISKNVQNKVSKTFIAAVDCTGHGVPGAFMSLIGHMLLDKIINILQITDPAQVLTVLNEEVQKTLRQQEMRNDAGMDMVIISLEKTTAQQTLVTFAGAKNPLLYLSQGAKKIQMLKGTRKSIGGQAQNHLTFDNQIITLESGSRIYLGSDGLGDQNNVKRKRYGMQRIIKLLEENHDLDLSKQKTALLEDLGKHMEGTEQRDDILMIGVKL